MLDGKEKPLYMDNGLHYQLTEKVYPSVKKKDFDWFVVVDGQEGAGKSVFAFQIAKTLHPNFTHENIAFTANDFIKLVVKAKKNECIVFDEAFTGLSSRTSLSEVNNILVSLMMEMRQKNLFIILVMPSFFMLDKYCVLHRAKGLFHVYTTQGRRGYWHFYSKKGMKYLYLTGKKFYEYTGSKPIMFGKFQDQYTINEVKYKTEKKKALHKKKRETKSAIHKFQRDILLWIIMKDYRKTQQETSDLCRKYGFKIDRSNISHILKEKEAQLKIKEIMDGEIDEEENTPPSGGEKTTEENNKIEDTGAENSDCEI